MANITPRNFKKELRIKLHTDNICFLLIAIVILKYTINEAGKIIREISYKIVE